MTGQWILSPFDQSDKSAKWPRVPDSECLLQENTIHKLKCISFSPKKADCSLCLHGPDSKVFLGTRTIVWHLIPCWSLQQEACTWVNETELLWTLVAEKEIDNLLCTSWSCSAAVKLTWNSKVPPRPIHWLCQSCLESALPWVNHTDILGLELLRPYLY